MIIGRQSYAMTSLRYHIQNRVQFYLRQTFLFKQKFFEPVQEIKLNTLMMMFAQKVSNIHNRTRRKTELYV